MIVLNNKFPTKIKLVYKSKVRDTTYECNGSVIFEPECRCLLLGFGFHHWDKDKMPRELIRKAISKDLGIIYVCDQLPKNPIIDSHIVYVVTGFEWFTHLLFRDTSIFKGVFHNGNRDSERFATIIASNGNFCAPLISNDNDLNQLDNIVQQIDRSEKSILVETFDGLGDVLLSLPAAYTLYHERGYKVNYYTNKAYAPIFENLDFIDNVYYNYDTIKTPSFVRYISLTHRLSTYSREYNQQNRIYSSAHFFGLTPDELTIKKPIISLTPEEMEYAFDFLLPHKNTVGVCWDAHGFSRSYPSNYTQSLCSTLKINGFTPVVLSLNEMQFNDAINLGGKLSLRQLFAIIWALDYVVTVDTGTLHIAGAFDKPTIALMGPIPAKWRCSTYKNCYPMEPKISCYPCMDGQFIEAVNRKCRNTAEGACMRKFKPKKIVDKLIKISKYSEVKKCKRKKK